MTPDPRAVSRAIVRWFKRSHRDLPWRRTRDPYAIWVSEIMLQQTRVEAVVPHYERFLARYPTVHALAAAEADDVLHAWSGLGYYRRARSLHAAAAVVVREHAGALPAAEDALLALPGIGRYTAGAIRSIAFGEAAPIVDGNVARVLSRVYALAGGPGGAAWAKRLWELATELVPAGAASAFNQGLMELGATVCVPRAPRCGDCPLAALCLAHGRGHEERYPRPKKRVAPRRIEQWAIVRVRARDGAVLMRRRGGHEINAGQWEVELTAPAARPPRGAAPLGPVRHSILDRSFRVTVYRVAARRGEAATKAGRRWVPPDGHAGLPVTTLTRKILRLLP